MKSGLKRVFVVILIVCVITGLGLSRASRVNAYYGGGYSSLLGGYGGLLGGYGGLYGGLMGGYGGLYGGLLGGYGLMGGLYGGLLGGYGGYGGLMGMYGGMYGMYGSMMSPFSFSNMYYPVQTAGGLTYQVPFLQIAPLLGVAGLYKQLFPNLFNPLPQASPIVNVSTPTSLGVTFPTPVGTFLVT